MTHQLHSLLSSPLRLSAVVVCFAFIAGCSGGSDASDDVGAESSPGGSSSAAAAGRPAVAGSNSVAGAGQFGGSGAAGNSGVGGNSPVGGAGGQLGGSTGAIATGGGGGATGGAGSSFGGGGATSGGGRSSFGGGGSTSVGGAGHAGQASGGSGGTAPTWTEIYTKFIANAQYASNCNGAACHNPGKQKGYDFSSQASGYASVKSKTSQFVSVLSSGSMPRGKPKMPAADLAIIRAWVAAGAQNN
jgi:hypothetical protein